MRVVLINKSDATGGAAVVTVRLLNALLEAGVDARLLVAEKCHDSWAVELAASPRRIKAAFLAERLKIFLANGMNRDTLFKIDTASDGLPLWQNRYVREADVVCLNWVNQGMLSLKGVRKILELGKPVVWTMHDMWNFTGICHHAGVCSRWLSHCGFCPLLGAKGTADDISLDTFSSKSELFHEWRDRMHFVAVSNWLADLARKSPIMSDSAISVIPNAFPFPEEDPGRFPHDKFRIVMGAARLDDPVKGFPILVEATKILASEFPAEAADMELVTFGTFKDPASQEGIALPHRHLGRIRGEEEIRKVYAAGDVVVSTSLYETLPGTLVEGQAYGCVPVSFNRGGQADIITHGSTGYLASWDDDLHSAARNIAEGLVWAKNEASDSLRSRMLREARLKFSAPAVASAYLSLFNSLPKN